MAREGAANHPPQEGGRASVSSVGRPVAPVGPVRFGERIFVESAHAESMPSFLEKSVP